MSRRDVFVLALVVLIAAAVRGYQLSSPGGYIFDEWGYARDACVYIGLGEQTCGVASEVTDEHPPLGKWLIASGIGVVGNNPIGHRIPSALAGIVSVGLLYLLARRLLGSTSAAGVSSALLALDPLSIIMSRIAMLDVFATCACLAAVLFVVLDRDSIIVKTVNPAALRRPWLVAAGVALGCAVATKWSAIPVFITLLLLAGAFELAYGRSRGRSRWSAARGVPALTVWLVVTPAIVYTASFAGRIEGTAAPPWEMGSWLGALLERQSFMFEFHATLSGTHPYSSPAWSWPLGKRPVLFFFDFDEAGRYREILAPANLGLWLPAFVAASAAAVLAVRRRRWLAAEVVVAACVMGSYLPWLGLTAGRSFVFLYYMTPAVPFLSLAVGWATTRLSPRSRRATSAAVLGLALAVLGFWWPLIYGHWLPYDEWRQRMLFVDCPPAQMSDGRWFPRFRGDPPPGWCWV